jgi:hypothetical protein
VRAHYQAWRKNFDSLTSEINRGFDVLETTLSKVEPRSARAQTASISNTRELSSWTSTEGHISLTRREARLLVRGIQQRGFDFYLVLAPGYVRRCVGLVERLNSAIAGAGVELTGAPTLHFGDAVSCGSGTHQWGLDTIGLVLPLRKGQLEAKALLEFRVDVTSERLSLTPAALVSICHNDRAVRAVLRERAREAMATLAFPINSPVAKVSMPGQGEGTVFGEEVSRGLALFVKQGKGRRPNREVIIPPSLPDADALVRLFLPQLAQQIQRAIGDVAGQNAGDYRHVTAGLRGGPSIDVQGRALTFGAFFNLLQQGGTNPLEWEYWVNTELGMKATLTPQGRAGFTVTTTVVSDRVASVGGRWRQGGDLFSIDVADQRVLNFVGAAKTGMNGKQFQSDLKLDNLSVRDIAYYPDSVYLVADLLTCS